MAQTGAQLAAEAVPERSRALAETSPFWTWAYLLLAMGVFFVLQYTPFSLLTMESSLTGEPMAEELARNISGGDPMRQAVLVLLGLVGGFSLLWRGRRGFEVEGLLGWMILFYVVWIVFSLAWAEDPLLTFKRVIIFLILSLAALAVVNRATLDQMVRSVFLSSLLYLAIGLGVEIAQGTLQPFETGYRFAGTFHPNYQGLNCSLLILSALCLARTGASPWLYRSIAFLGFALLLLTRSRTSLGSLGFALFVYAWMVWSLRGKVLLAIAAGWLSSYFLLLFSDSIFSRFLDVVMLGRDVTQLETLTGRIPLWAASLQYVFERPMAGYGYQGFWTPGHLNEIARRAGWAPYASHSTYFDLLLEVGMIGLLAYVIIHAIGIGRAGSRFRRTGNTAYAFMAALLCFCVADGFLESLLLKPNWLTFLTMIVLIILGFQKPEESDAPRHV